MTTSNRKTTCARMVAHVLQDIVLKQEIPLKKRGQTRPFQARLLNLFENENRLKLTTEGYIDRLAKYLHISDSSFVLALIYIDRLTESTDSVTLNEYSVHRLITISLLLAMKYNDDV
mmetsp:Transcript_18987/g.21277  ORF Transcript_18987/g.21277 Transcript_18987/m.21277 type:complete len:117 (+) Transcript_18987:107-457(+)